MVGFPSPPARGPPLPRIFCGELNGCFGAGWSLRVVSSGGHVRDPGYITLIGHISYGERAKQAGCEMRDTCRTFEMVVRKPELVPGFYCTCTILCCTVRSNIMYVCSTPFQTELASLT